MFKSYVEPQAGWVATPHGFNRPLVYQTSRRVRVELYFYMNISFSSNKFTSVRATRVETLYISEWLNYIMIFPNGLDKSSVEINFKKNTTLLRR